MLNEVSRIRVVHKQTFYNSAATKGSDQSEHLHLLIKVFAVPMMFLLSRDLSLRQFMSPVILNRSIWLTNRWQRDTANIHQGRERGRRLRVLVSKLKLNPGKALNFS